MLVYAQHSSPRLEYVIHFLSNEMSAGAWRITDDIDEFKSAIGAKINYSNSAIDTLALQIIPHGLLNESGIRSQNISVTQREGLPLFFQTGGELGFDLFAAIFYLLSRYEEYLSFKKDLYGRFPSTESLAQKNGFLKTPLINLWMQRLGEQLSELFPGESFKKAQFTFLPSYDIDMAWSFKHKGFWRNGANFLKEAFSLRFAAFAKRFRVLTGKEKDPFDQFGWLNQLHEQYHLKPYYFFLVAAHANENDKNISPHNAAMKTLISDHVIRYPVGLHPSWVSNKNITILEKEKGVLSEITGTNINASRQHFLKLNLPETYRNLLDAGILFDFSMGYADDNGFRASAASPFYWYDLKRETATRLLIFPFCFMEVTSIFYKKSTPAQGLAELQQLYDEVKNVNGFFSMIWHNSSFTDEGMYKGWKEVYNSFLAKNGSYKTEAPPTLFH